MKISTTQFSPTLLALVASSLLLAIHANIPTNNESASSNLSLAHPSLQDRHFISDDLPIFKKKRVKTRRKNNKLQTMDNTTSSSSFNKNDVSSDANASSVLLPDDEEAESRRNIITVSPVETTTTVDTALALLVEANQRSYDHGIAYQPHHYQPAPFHQVDFSPLFLALIPIALFLGAAAAFALSVATSSSSASASAQQQQQQEESSNNNNAANSNNNNALLAALLASTTNNNNVPTIIVLNSTGSVFPYFTYGRSMSDSFRLPWRRRPRRRYRRTHLSKP